jgi:hypothetical protein
VKRSRLVRLAIFASAVALGTGSASCTGLAHHPPPPPDPATVAAGEWPEARRVALNFALSKDQARADSVLRAFAARFPGTEASAETLFYRALFRLDPAGEGNVPAEALREARARLEAYIAGGPSLPHYGEAVILRRVTGHLDSLHSTEQTVRTYVGNVSPTGIAELRDTLKTRDDELARVKAELDQTKAELDRIRRRLAPPRP